MKLQQRAGCLFTILSRVNQPPILDTGYKYGYRLQITKIINYEKFSSLSEMVPIDTFLGLLRFMLTEASNDYFLNFEASVINPLGFSEV